MGLRRECASAVVTGERIEINKYLISSVMGVGGVGLFNSTLDNCDDAGLSGLLLTLLSILRVEIGLRYTNE